MIISITTHVTVSSVLISYNHRNLSTDELECCTSGKLLLVGCDDGSAHLVGVEGRKVLASFTFGAAVLCACWATPTHGVVGLSDGQLVVIDAVVSTYMFISGYHSYFYITGSTLITFFFFQDKVLLTATS